MSKYLHYLLKRYQENQNITSSSVVVGYVPLNFLAIFTLCDKNRANCRNSRTRVQACFPLISTISRLRFDSRFEANRRSEGPTISVLVTRHFSIITTLLRGH